MCALSYILIQEEIPNFSGRNPYCRTKIDMRQFWPLIRVLTTWCDVCGHNLPFSLPHSWLRRARQKEGDTWAARQDREALWHLTSRQAEPEKCDSVWLLWYASNITTPSLPSLTNLTLQGRRHIDVCKKASSTTGAKELKGRIGNEREVTLARDSFCALPKEKCGERKIRWQSVTLQLRAVHLQQPEQLTIAIADCILSN